jgi:hypothetical protein
LLLDDLVAPARARRSDLDDQFRHSVNMNPGRDFRRTLVRHVQQVGFDHIAL